MLILTRRVDERIVIGGPAVLLVVSIDGRKVRLGFEADPSVPIHRGEVAEAIGSADGRDRPHDS